MAAALDDENGSPTPVSQRRTKIVATLGPASREARVLERLVEAGMDVARINLSHGTTAEHADSIAAVRRAAARRPFGRPHRLARPQAPPRGPAPAARGQGG